MKAWLKKLAGAGRPKVIAVVACSRADAAAGIAHARTSNQALPVWVWCTEAGEAPAPCERYLGAARTRTIARELLRSVWPALTVIGWTGRSAAMAKLAPLLCPPFRAVVFNEAAGFFPAHPVDIAVHLRRRLRDALLDAATCAGQVFRSLAWRAGERLRDVVVWLWNALLAFAAWCAAPFAPLAFRLMERRTEGRESLFVHMPPAASGSFVPVDISARAWRRGRFLRALRNSDAPFAILHRGPFERLDCERLIHLARSRNAFAAARQVAFTGWRRQVLSKHPFRPLQQGEATALLAPHSSLIAVRRDVLLQLGIPGSITSGGALMEICWKAAAAGLDCVAQGFGEAVPQEPAMPLEDLEFALRLRFHHELKRLRPLQIAEKRGNVAWLAGSERPAGEREKPAVLVVSPYLPFPLSHGGAVRIYNLCKALAPEVDFTLACFREANETVHYEELHRVFHSVYVVDIDEKSEDCSVPAQIAAYRNSAMASLIRRICASGDVDAVQLEYTQMAEYREYCGGVPTILVEHDITFTLYRQIALSSRTANSKREYERWRDFERVALQTSGTIWTMSERDKSIARRYGALPRNIAVVPNGVDLNRFQPFQPAGGSPAVLFVGSFRHLPNLLAFELLIERIMPLVWSEFPEARLHAIAGPNHEEAARAAGKAQLLANRPGLHLEGFVADVREAYRACHVVAVPLPISAGTNIKVMEAMACGRALVGTPVGCQGLELRDGEDVLIRSEPEHFAAALIELLRNPEERNAMGARARRTVESRFGWESIALQALESYRRAGIVAARNATPARNAATLRRCAGE